VSWFATHIGWVYVFDQGLQLNLSWGLLAGVPVTLVGIWVFHQVAKLMPKWSKPVPQ
jgi:hypothetical protein